MISNFIQYKQHILKDKRSNKFKFLNDGRNYYVYRVTNLKTKKYYYGSRIQKLDNMYDDFWSYGTSGCEKRQILLEKQNYTTKIIKQFDNYNDCIIYESYLHQYFNVRHNDKFFNKSNQTPFDFLPDRRGMINCLTNNNEPTYITVDEYKNNNAAYKSYSTDKITVYEIKTNRFISISIKEFYTKRHLYKTLYQDKKHTAETKNKMSIKAKNRKVHSSSKHIEIYDYNGVKRFETFGNFKSFCLTNKLPFTALKISYQNNGTKIYINSNNQFKNLANDKGWLLYFGWFAKISD